MWYHWLKSIAAQNKPQLICDFINLQNMQKKSINQFFPYPLLSHIFWASSNAKTQKLFDMDKQIEQSWVYIDTTVAYTE